MPDNLSTEDRRKTMQAVKAKGTRLEKRLFSMLAGLGIRNWKKNVVSVIGKPDVVFPKQHIAVFIDGCFWHGCPHCKKKMPETNYQYWERKIGRNILLSKANVKQLRASGWTAIRIWEHEFKAATGLKKTRARICNALRMEK